MFHPIMMSLFRLILFTALQFLAIITLAKTCEEVLTPGAGSSKKFSPVKMILGARKAAMLGRRHDTASRGGGGSRASVENQAPQNTHSFGFIQASVEIDRVLDILDPIPPEYSSVPIQRKFTIKSSDSKGLIYIYQHGDEAIEVPRASLHFMAEVITLMRSAAHKGEISEVTSDEFVRNWFREAIATKHSFKYEILSPFLMAISLDKYVHQLSLAISSTHQGASTIRAVQERIRAQVGNKYRIERSLEMMESIFGPKAMEQAYNQFVKMLVSRVQNPTLESYYEISVDGHGQHEISIDVAKMRSVLDLYHGHQTIYAKERNVPTGIEVVSSLKNYYLLDATSFLNGLKAYQVALETGLPTQKDPLLLMSILIHKLRDDMGYYNFQEFHKRLVRQSFYETDPEYPRFFKKAFETMGSDWRNFSIRLESALSAIVYW